MSELTRYYSEILSNTDRMFYCLRKYLKELAKELLLDGVYIEKVVSSATSAKEIHMLAWGYDDDGDLNIHARWDRTNENVSNPFVEKFELAEIELEDVDEET